MLRAISASSSVERMDSWRAFLTVGSALVLLHHAAVGFPGESAMTVALDAGEAQDQRLALGLFQAGLSVGAGQQAVRHGP